MLFFFFFSLSIGDHVSFLSAQINKGTHIATCIPSFITVTKPDYLKTACCL